MQLRFGRDLILPSDHSKYDYLALSCARRIRGTVFGDADRNCLSVVQCGDGRIVAPSGFRGGRYIAILHDWNDSYSDIVSGARGGICIGFSKNGLESVETYPLDDCDMHRLPKDDATKCVIAGDGALPKADVPSDAVSFNSFQGKMPYSDSRFMLSILYRSACRIVHCGNGNGTGYLGAMAAYHCDDVIYVNGTRPQAITPFKDFKGILESVAR